jgi:hypothetical protein
MAVVMWGATARPADAFTLRDLICIFFECEPEPSPHGGCEEFGCGSNSPVVDGAVIEVPAAPTAKPTFVRARSGATGWIPLDEILCWFGWCGSRGGGGCDDFGCGTNSPVVDGAVIEVRAAPTAPPAVVRARSMSTSWIPLDEILCWFGWCGPRPHGGCDDEFGCGTNSPVVDGAAIENQAN